MAEGVFRHLTRSNPSIGTLDSCGTSGYYHADEPPDPRTMAVLREHGITDYEHRARSLQSADFTRFDYILVMDRYNLRDVEKLQQRTTGGGGDGAQKVAQVMLFGDYGGCKGEEVIDPYYGADDGFTTAYNQMVRFTKGFLQQVLGPDAHDTVQ